MIKLPTDFSKNQEQALVDYLRARDVCFSLPFGHTGKCPVTSYKWNANLQQWMLRITMKNGQEKWSNGWWIEE